MRARILVSAFLFALPSLLAQTGLENAVAALQRGDLPAAEQILRTALRSHPNDGDALAVLAVVLDQEKKFPEASEIYRRATAAAPRSPGLLNNYGNHLIATGKSKEARIVFAKVLALDPAHSNALVQSARLALEAKDPTDALRYLDRLPNETSETPDLSILRMQSLFAAGRMDEAETMLSQLSQSVDSFRLGEALASVSEYARAETLFSQAVQTKPDDFEALHNLGLAAAHAGHPDRARAALQSALQEQPENADVLYDLAAVEVTANQDEQALRLLVEAAKIAPARPDVLRLLAQTTVDLGYFGDAVKAWDRYLAVVPNDDSAARDRAFAMTALGDDVAGGIAGLQKFVRKHPQDAVGHFELGTAEAPTAPEIAARELDRALVLQPDLVAAHVARGLLNYRKGDNAAALPDFQFAATHDPANPLALDRLGQTLVALDRPADAVPFLRRAADLAPRDSRMQLHLARALTGAGNEAEAKQILVRVRELGADKSASPRPAGLVDFLSLSPEEQLKRYRAGVERTVAKNPNNAEAQVRYLELLLGDGKIDEAAAVAQKLKSLQPSAVLLNDAAGSLLASEQYRLAMDLLQSPDARHPTLNLAIATFRTDNPHAGLVLLDRIPDAERDGDYHLARAQMLLSENISEKNEDRAELELALRLHPKRQYLYRQTALMLIARQRGAEAKRLLTEAIRLSPDDSELQAIDATLRR